MCIYDLYRYFEMLNCIIGIYIYIFFFFWHFSCKMFYIGGAKHRKIFSRKTLLHV